MCTFSVAARRWLEDHHHVWKACTIRGYGMMVDGRLEAELGNAQIHTIRGHAWESLVERLLRPSPASGLHALTVKATIAHLRAVRSVLAHAEGWYGELSPPPPLTELLARYRAAHGMRVRVPDQWIDDVLYALDGHHRAPIRIALWSGASVESICSLRREHLKPVERIGSAVALRLPGGRSQRHLYLISPAYTALIQHAELTRGAQPTAQQRIFLTPSGDNVRPSILHRLWQQEASRTTRPHLGIEELNHHAISHMAAHGLGTREIAHNLGVDERSVLDVVNAAVLKNPRPGLCLA